MPRIVMGAPPSRPAAPTERPGTPRSASASERPGRRRSSLPVITVMLAGASGKVWAEPVAVMTTGASNTVSGSGATPAAGSVPTRPPCLVKR